MTANYTLPVDYRKLSPQERRAVRLQYIAEQQDLCAHCQAALSGPPAPEILGSTINHSLFPEGFFDYPVHLHHCHHTGMTISAVHARCNAVLWQYYGE